MIDRLDIVCGPTGRRKWPDEVKGRLVAESYKTALSVSEFARRNALIPSQIFGWRRDAKEGKFALPADDGDAFFAPLMLDAPIDEASEQTDCPRAVTEDRIELEAGGVLIRLSGDTPAARIAEIARALR